MKVGATISFIIPVYNVFPYLEQTLDSVLNQTYPATEIILIDDGSTDGSGEIMQRYASRFKQIKYIQRPFKTDNVRTAAQALNIGLDVASSDYVALMDADDWCDSRRLEIQLRFMEQNPTVVACGTWANICWDDNRKWIFPIVDKRFANDEWLKVYMFGQSPFLQNSVMIRRHIIEYHHLRYDENYHYAEDYDFYRRLVRLGRIANIEEPLVNYRMHTGQSIRQGAFKGYLKKNIQLQLLSCFDANEDELEIHWKLIHIREDYDPQDLEAMYLWIDKLSMMNHQNKVFDAALFDSFLQDCWFKRITKRRTYSRNLISFFLAHPHLLANQDAIQLALFLLKCLLNRNVGNHVNK